VRVSGVGVGVRVRVGVRVTVGVRVGVRVIVGVATAPGSDRQNRARPLPDTLTTPQPSNTYG
jgi:hypothetical protein